LPNNGLLAAAPRAKRRALSKHEVEMAYGDGKKVFITGGSAGIGKALALKLAANGASVVVCARRQGPLEETVEAMTQAGPSTAKYGSIAADVTDRAAMQAAATSAITLMGGIDIVIANSGFAECKPIIEADEAHFRRLMDVNFFGHINTVQPFLEPMSEQRSGQVVLVASMLAVLSVWGYGGYSASKFAIRGFAEALRQEMLLKDVDVRLFLPPTTDTPGLAKENEGKPPITLEMEEGSALNATHSAEKVADKMLSWMRKGNFVGYATWDSWLQYFAARHLPNVTLKMADGEMHGAIKRIKAKGGTI
jgi:NAD(P)-dependent dehydrogenase (short-subunit alcohol dehydrogenase family)